MSKLKRRARATAPNPVQGEESPGEERRQLKALLRLTRESLKTYPSHFAVRLKRPDGTERILYKAQPVQDRLHACTAPNILFGGAAGGSKSHGLRWDAIIKCLQTPGLKVLFLRRTYPELERTHLLRLPLDVPQEIATYNTQLKRLTFVNGSLIQFGHCQYEKDLADHLSTEWDIIYIDEASTFTPHMLELLPSRARTSLPPRNGYTVVPQFIVASNPGGDGHLFLETHFISKAPVLDDGQEYDPNEWAFIPAKVTDNAYISDAYIHRLLGLSKTERDAYLYGKWSAFSGQFFREWDPAIHTTSGDGLELPPWMEREGGMDWGYDPDPFYVVVAAFDAFGRAWLYREITGHRSSPREVAEQIAAACPEGRQHGFLIRGDTQMWVKSPESGVSIAEQINDRLAELGSQITLIQANKDRVNGWMRVRAYLNPRRRRPDAPGTTPWLQVVTASEDGREMGCPYLIQTIGTMRHHDRKKGDMAPNAHDHPCLVAGTLIETPGGSVPIERLRAGDLVLTRQGYRPVVSVTMTDPAAPVFDLLASSGAHLTGTGNHPVWVEGRGFTPLRELTAGDILTSCRPTGAPVTVSRRPQPSGFAPVYNLSVGDTPEYFANGLLVHNCDGLRYLLMARPPLSEIPQDERDVPKNRQAGHANTERFQRRLHAQQEAEQEASTGSFTVEVIDDADTMPLDFGDDTGPSIAAVWE